MIWVAPFLASSSMDWMPSVIKFWVVSSFHISRIVFRTRLDSSVRSPLMAKRNVGHFMGGVTIRKVTLDDAQTVCCRRIWRCTSFRLKIRKDVGSILLLVPSSLGWGVATPRSGDWVISATAAKMRLLTSSWSLGFRASLSKGIARSFSPGKCLHSSIVWGAMNSYAASGNASFTGVVIPLEYLSSGSRVWLRRGLAWALRFAASVTWSSCGSCLEADGRVWSPVCSGA